MEPKDFTPDLRTMIIPLLLATLFEIYLYVDGHRTDLVWAADVIAFGVIAYLLIDRRKRTAEEVAYTCGVAGILLGLIAAITQIVLNPTSFYLWFKLITHPLLAGVVGVLSGYLAAVGFRMIFPPSTHSS
jgi:hypothetical protein